MPLAFVSFSHHDEVQARNVAGGLTAAGIEPWICTANITAGEKWPKALGEAIARSEALILVWSSAAAASELVELEWNIALALKKTVIPWVLDETELPLALRPYHAIRSDVPATLIEAVKQTLAKSQTPASQALAAQVVDRLGAISEREPKHVLEAVKTVFEQQGWTVAGSVYQAQGDIHIIYGDRSAASARRAWAERWQVWLGLVVGVLAAITLGLLIVSKLQTFSFPPTPPEVRSTIEPPPTEPQVIAGIISNERGRPLSGVKVSLPAVSVSTLTSEAGYYRLEVRVSGQDRVILIADKTGYEAYQTYVSPGNSNMNFALRRAR